MTYKTEKTQYLYAFFVGHFAAVSTAHTIPKLPTQYRVNT